jgi:DNA mismatch repair protein MutL
LGHIRLLPDNLVNQIAAGEVIERPSSVVKELVENALDAGAGRIRVELEAGGRERILVEDDGAGMDADDLLMALERHATSKLLSERDLFAIATLGFRGEALPSIASVSRLVLWSRPADEAEGRTVSVEGGRFGAVEPCGLAQGTRVEVRDLFYNVPARRKFLRSPGTELTHVVTLLEHYALARPDVSLALAADGRTVLDLAPATDRVERFFELFPEIPRADMVAVELEGPRVTLRGLAGKPERNLGSPRYQFTLVNGRFVRDRVLQHAISQAYEDTHPRGRYPVVLLSITVPLDKVDVNVHPTKREVRFVDSGAVHDAVATALRQAIAPGQAFPTRGEGAPWPSWPPSGAQGVADAPGAFGSAASGNRAGGLFSHFSQGQEGEAVVSQGSPLRALAQWRDSFILCDGPEGLSVVDQHVAHERIRFEQFRRFLDRPGPQQPFLVPWVYELPKAMAHRTEELAELLSAQGFEAEPSGPDSVAVRSAPAFLRPGETERILTEFVQSLAEVLKTPRTRWKEVLVMRSCRGSVMLNDPMSLEKMQYLLDTLFSLGAPLTCPHGRPIVFTLREAEILAKFDRT